MGFGSLFTVRQHLIIFLNIVQTVHTVGPTETFEMSDAMWKSFIVLCSLVANFQYTKQSRFFKIWL